MKNNILEGLYIVFVWVVLFVGSLWWGLFAHAANGPFCDSCTVVTLNYLTEDQFNAIKASTIASCNSMIATCDNMINTRLADFNAHKTSFQNNILPLYLSGAISQVQFDAINNQIQGMSENFYLVSTDVTSIKSSLNAIIDSFNSVVISHDQFCTVCTGSSTGDDGDCTCTCNCPDYTDLLTDISIFAERTAINISDLHNFLVEYLDYFVGLFDDWFNKWVSQDDKLTPLIVELKPMLANIKQYYDDYYNSTMDSTAWTNIKKVVDSIVEKDIVKNFDRMLTDYAGSSFNSASWSAMSSVNVSLKNIFNADTGFGGLNGEGTIKKYIQNYSEQLAHPIGSYLASKEIKTEAAWLQLNWFQRITSAFGMLLFPAKRDDEPTLPTVQEEQSKAEAVKSGVAAFGTAMNTGVTGLYASYSGLFNSFKSIFSTDQFPTTIRLHGGWTYEFEGMSIPAVEPVEWVTDTTPALRTSCDLIRSFCGLLWWSLGFFIMFGIIRSAYGFLVYIVEKVLLVVGSLGRSGGSSA